MRWTPHQLIEGCAIGAYAIGAERMLHLHPRRVHRAATHHAGAAVAEAYKPRGAGRERLRHRAGGSTCILHRGAGAYICGEETAMMNSIEGKRGNPRIKPPFPASAGLLGLPDHHQQRRDPRRGAPHPQPRRGVVQGLCLSNPKSTGTKLISVCGHVQRPGNYEVTMGTPMKELIYRHVRRHAAGPDPQGGDSGRLVGADHDRGRGRRLRRWTTRASWPRARCWARPA